ERYLKKYHFRIFGTGIKQNDKAMKYCTKHVCHRLFWHYLFGGKSMTNVVDEIATKLVNAYQTKQSVAFIRHQYTLDEETAYSVQDELVKRRCELENATVSGYKISMTSDDTQAIANTNEPAYGTLLTTDIVRSGASVPLSSLFSPLMETEIIFHIMEDLTPNAGGEEIL